jgi:hypothetical protein
MELTKLNTKLIINSFDKDKFLELKDFLSNKNQCANLKMMFRKIDRFLFFISKGGSVCIYYDSNGFNGYTNENPIYLPNKKPIDFDLFKKLNSENES